ncbi:MAG: septal ring lytic transglycosylase RlpA family protein [Chloroflexi bacterium]|nr:septal ring lytic transglycosylase RlpA family protein [Chloroflexota bacterium]MCL5075899.1 septal ring lytic transglycosylase RlpA family protein [Chloroflexota bacterium]
MKRFLIGRVIPLVLATIVVAVPLSGSEAASPEDEARLDYAMPGGHFFTQANGFPPGTSPKGYRITDEDGLPFWTEFQRLGGVTVLGYPISRRFSWNGFSVQATQKGVLQWRPEQKRFAFVNIFDELHNAGKDDWLASVRSTPPPLPGSFDAGKPWGEVIRQRLALLDSHPAIKARYQSVSDPLNLYGLPTSKVEDRGPVYVVRLQRAVIQQWKVDVPWAKAGQVTVANGGDLAKEAGLFPHAALRLENPVGEDWKNHRYRVVGLATWYGPGFHGQRMANGQVYDMNDPTTTSCNMYPLGTKLRVTNKEGKSIVVAVRDTGAFTYPIVVDLSYAAFTALAPPTAGIIEVLVEVIP